MVLRLFRLANRDHPIGLLKMALVNLTKDFIRQKFELGKMDCFRLVYDYLKKQMPLPEEFKGVTLDTYENLFNEKPEAARGLMVDFLKEYLNEIKPYEVTAGDIVVLNYNYSPFFLGIAVGNASVLLATESKGVDTFPLRYYKIVRAFRWPG